jgi:DNA repair and recombination protein RAD52
MSPSLSAHLIESFEQQLAKGQSKIPFQATFHNMTNILTSGNMSYNASLHGMQSFQGSNTSPNFSLENSYQETSMSTLESIATLQAKLNQRLGPEYISQRPAPGGAGKLSYIEGWKIISLANEVFGFNGWSSNVVTINIDFIDFSEESKRYNVGVTAVVRVTLRDGVYHEDVGYGLLENSKSKGTAIDKVIDHNLPFFEKIEMNHITV